MRGPQVLMALREPGDSGVLNARSGALLQAEQSGPRQWRVPAQANQASLTLVPFAEVGDRSYCTYLHAT